MITGDFSGETARQTRALEAAAIAQAALGGALRLAGERQIRRRNFPGLGTGGNGRKALGISMLAPIQPVRISLANKVRSAVPTLAHASSSLRRSHNGAGRSIAADDQAPLRIIRAGLKYIAQGALQSAPVTATGLAAAMLNLDRPADDRRVSGWRKVWRVASGGIEDYWLSAGRRQLRRQQKPSRSSANPCVVWEVAQIHTQRSGRRSWQRFLAAGRSQRPCRAGLKSLPGLATSLTGCS